MSWMTVAKIFAVVTVIIALYGLGLYVRREMLIALLQQGDADEFIAAMRAQREHVPEDDRAAFDRHIVELEGLAGVARERTAKSAAA